jgi:hypothetical protein
VDGEQGDGGRGTCRKQGPSGSRAIVIEWNAVAATLDQWSWAKPISQSEGLIPRRLEDDISAMADNTKA